MKALPTSQGSTLVSLLQITIANPLHELLQTPKFVVANEDHKSSIKTLVEDRHSKFSSSQFVLSHSNFLE